MKITLKPTKQMKKPLSKINPRLKRSLRIMTLVIVDRVKTKEIFTRFRFQKEAPTVTARWVLSMKVISLHPKHTRGISLS